MCRAPSSEGKRRGDPGGCPEAKHEYEKYLEDVAKRFTEGDFAKYNLSVTTSVPIDMDVAEAIVQAAEQAEGTEFAGHDLIVMATHGRGGVQRWMLGSVAERVLHTTRVPLMVEHPVHTKHETHETAHAVAHQSNVGGLMFYAVRGELPLRDHPY